MTYAIIYTIGLTATFSYLVLSLWSLATDPVTYRQHLKAVWGPYLITSALWFVLLPFLGIYEGVKRVGRVLRIYKGY
jgi:hypothetical protein